MLKSEVAHQRHETTLEGVICEGEVDDVPFEGGNTKVCVLQPQIAHSEPAQKRTYVMWSILDKSHLAWFLNFGSLVRRFLIREKDRSHTQSSAASLQHTRAFAHFAGESCSLLPLNALAAAVGFARFLRSCRTHGKHSVHVSRSSRRRPASKLQRSSQPHVFFKTHGECLRSPPILLVAVRSRRRSSLPRTSRRNKHRLPTSRSRRASIRSAARFRILLRVVRPTTPFGKTQSHIKCTTWTRLPTSRKPTMNRKSSTRKRRFSP